MAGQIVAQGDPAEDTTAINIKDGTDKRTMLAYLKDKMNESGKPFRTFIAAVERRIVLTESYMFSKLFPKTFAKTVTRKQSFIYWNSGSYDEMWIAMRVCTGDNSIVKAKTTETKTKTNPDGTTSTYEEETITYYKNLILIIVRVIMLLEGINMKIYQKSLIPIRILILAVNWKQ